MAGSRLAEDPFGFVTERNVRMAGFRNSFTGPHQTKGSWAFPCFLAQEQLTVG